MKDIRNELGIQTGLASKLSEDALDQLQAAAEERLRV